MNQMLRANAGKSGADFCRGVLSHLGIKYTVDGTENLPAGRRVIFVCNHPLGGLDGMILIDWLSAIYGNNIKLVVNDLLMAIEPLREVFLPINKHGKQSRFSSVQLDQAMESDNPILIFPAGLVSRKNKSGIIADLEWNKMFIQKSIKFKRPVIPIHFSGQNSSFFYNFAKLRTALGLKFNIEMLRLPKEVFLSRDKQFHICVGRPIDHTKFTGGHNAAAEAGQIKKIVYSLDKTILKPH